MEIWCRSISDSVYRHTRRRETDANRITLHTGRNMTDAAQLLVRDAAQGFWAEVEEVTGACAVMEVTVGAQGYEIYNDGLPYPDLLTGKQRVYVKASTTQGFVLLVKTAPDTPCGSTNIAVRIKATRDNGDIHYMNASVTVTVHRAVIGEPKNSAFGHEYFFDLGDGSAETLIPYARAMKDLRVNSLYVNAVTLLARGGTKRTTRTTWSLDFSAFDKFVELFLEHGSFRYLTITGSIRPVTGDAFHSIDDNGYGTNLPLFTDDADMEAAGAWAETFFGGIAEHCRERGWYEMLRFHLEDEPHTTQSWLWAREICHRVAPGVPCMEPIDTKGIGRALGNECDIPVPRLEVYDHDAEYYTKYAEDGGEVWCYSCCFPEEPWWLNKFIDLPARYARMIKWACFAQDITGFLHWGFNFWSPDTPYGRNPNTRFKGDGFIVYPDEENGGVLMSNRGLATTMGIEEWELLHKLAETDKTAAKALACRTAKTFRDFTDDPSDLDDTRAALLTYLDMM